jgi:nucleotide-binding universal stress UspA family protein
MEAEFRRVIGHAGSVICDFAKEEGFDLIVVGNRKHNPLQGMVLGSVSDHVVQHSPCPVLVVGHCRS